MGIEFEYYSKPNRLACFCRQQCEGHHVGQSQPQPKFKLDLARHSNFATRYVCNIHSNLQQFSDNMKSPLWLVRQRTKRYS